MTEKKRLVAYIDGFSLYYGLRESGWKRFYWLNLCSLIENLCEGDQEVSRVKYFTSVVSPTKNDPDKHLRQKAYLDALGSLPKLQIIYGRYELRPQECPKCGCQPTCSGCGLPLEKRVEKKTDVNIAVELLTDAVQHSFDVAVLISGDSDLAPAILRARNFATTAKFVVAHPPHRVSGELGRAAHSAFTIYRSIFSGSRLPDTVPIGKGLTVTRPVEWV
jgi:uncharacterized LabA/DUF88 family protein